MSVAAAVLGNRAEFELAVGPHQASDLAVVSFEAREELSRPYEAVVTFAADARLDTTALEREKALVTVVEPDGVARYFDGVAEGMERLGPSRHPEKHLYRLRLRPRLWLLSARVRSRIFQDQSPVEIAVAVLKEGNVAHRLSLGGNHAKREYCVQYRESDLDFVSRLLEESGIFYFFEHEKGAHTLVLGDARGAFPELPGGKRIAFHDEQGMAPSGEAFTAFGSRHRTRPGAVVVRDVNYLHPQLDLTARAGDGKAELETYDHHGRYGMPDEGRALARIRLEEARVKAALWSGRSTSRRLCPGYVFEVSRHPDGRMNGEYVAVSVVHRGDQPEALAGALATGKSGYQSRVVCLRTEIPYRPERRTAHPKIAGWQTAVVVGPAGEEIHTDEHGRIKLQFRWDREGKEDDHASCWIRVAQALAGPGFGALWLPRVGQEVLVSFEEGDPDRPAVMGAAYNGMNPTPLDLPAEKTRSTLKSRSSPEDGGVGFNELRFEDAAGSEEVYLHAQKDLKIDVLNDKAQEVGGNETLTVAKDRSRTVLGNQSLVVKGNDDGQVLQNQTLTVTQNRTTAVGLNHGETVAGNQSVNVGGAHQLLVTLGAMESVGLGKVLSVGGAYLVNVGLAMNELVGGAKAEEVIGAKAEVIGAKKTEKVFGSRSLEVGGDLSESIGQSRTLKVGKDLVLNVSGGMQHAAQGDYHLKSKGLTMVASDQFTLKVGGATIQVNQSGDVVISGAKVQLRSSGDLTLEAPKISENG
jgi:type VI secretion system secreted protein VgrG